MGGEALTSKSVGAVRAKLHTIDASLRHVGGMTEDFFRVAAWAGGMRHTSGDLYGARAFVMVRHGDYADLTETENFVRDLVPFYKWMRTNVPYQFRMLAENPGFFTTMDKAQTFVYDVRGLNRYEEERKQPEWARRGFNIPVSIGGFDAVTLDLPYTDLYNGARDYFSAGFPVLRNIFESFGSKQNTFTGAPLGEKMVPLSGIWAAPGLRHLVAALPWAEEGPEGQVFIPDTIDNVLAGIPIYSRYRNWMLSDPERVEKRTATVFSAMLGLGLVRDDATAVELAFYYDEILPTMERLKSMGYVFPTKDQLEDAGALVYDYGAMPSAEELFPTGVAGAVPQPGT